MKTTLNFKNIFVFVQKRIIFVYQLRDISQYLYRHWSIGGGSLSINSPLLALEE